MKIVCLLVLFAGFASAGTIPSSSPGLKLLVHFDNQRDEVKQIYLSTAANKAVAYEQGRHGRALLGTSTNGWLQIPDDGAWSYTNLSIMALVKPSGYPTYGARILHKNNGNASQASWSFALKDGQNTGFEFGVFNLAHSKQLATYSGPVPVGKWTVLAGTFDSTSIKVYKDGVMVSSKTWTGPATAYSYPVSIGGDLVNTGYKFYGDIDELAAWNRTLTAAEIQKYSKALLDRVRAMGQ